MPSTQREDSPSVDEYEAAYAKFYTIKSQYSEKREKEELAFKERRSKIQIAIEDLRQELQRIKTEHKKLIETQEQLYKQELKTYLNVPSLLRQRHDRHLPKGHNDDPVSEVRDVIVVQTSEAESSSEDNIPRPVLQTQKVSRKQLGRNEAGQFLDPKNTTAKLGTETRSAVRKKQRRESNEDSDAPLSKRHRRSGQAESNIEQLRSSEENMPIDEDVASPVAGEIYRVMLDSLNLGFAAVILPPGDFNAIGISKSLCETTLKDSIPKCYRYDEKNMEILGWEKDYDDDGPKVIDREFPCMLFNTHTLIPLEGEYLAVIEEFRWISAKSMSPFDFNAGESRSTVGYAKAKRFSDRLRLIREKLASENQQDNCGNRVTETYSTVENEMENQTIRVPPTATPIDELPRQPSVNKDSHKEITEPLSHSTQPQQSASPREAKKSGVYPEDLNPSRFSPQSLRGSRNVAPGNDHQQPVESAPKEPTTRRGGQTSPPRNDLSNTKLPQSPKPLFGGAHATTDTAAVVNRKNTRYTALGAAQDKIKQRPAPNNSVPNAKANSPIRPFLSQPGFASRSPSPYTSNRPRDNSVTSSEVAKQPRPGHLQNTASKALSRLGQPS